MNPPVEAPVHARGIPGYPEPTLCGAAGVTLEVCGEITCPDCIEILFDLEKLAARAEALQAQYGAESS